MWEAGGGGSADLNIYFPLRGSRAGSWWWKWGDPKAWLVVCDAHRPACLGGKRGARHAEVTGEDPWAKSSLLICFVWLTQYFGKKKKISSKLSTFKTRESSPKKNPEVHILIIITKANISVWLTARGALVSAPLTPRDRPVLRASDLPLAAACSWGSRGGDPGCSWCRVCLPGGRGPGWR